MPRPQNRDRSLVALDSQPPHQPASATIFSRAHITLGRRLEFDWTNETLPMAKDVLIFHSDRFSLDPPVGEGGVKADLPLGDDVAAEIKSGIESRTDEWSIDEPVREDFGTVFMLRRDKVAINITIVWAAILDREDYWIVQFGEARGCIGQLLPKQHHVESITEIKQIVDSIVREDSSTYREARWIDDAEFRRIY